MPEYNEKFAEKMHDEIRDEASDIESLVRWADPSDEEQFVDDLLLIEARVSSLYSKIKVLSDNLYR
jgi:hypothetical protein